MIQLCSQKDQPLYKDAVIGLSSEFQFIKGSDIVKLEIPSGETTEWKITVYEDFQQVCCVTINYVGMGHSF